MLFLYTTFICLVSLQAIWSVDAASVPKGTNTVHLRIEGENSTYFEGPITSGPRYIHLQNTQGGEPAEGVLCNGLNHGANPTPGNTALDALDAAAKLAGFTYDGYYDDYIEDFYITRISTSIESTTSATFKFWGYVVNYQISTHPEGLTLSECQQEVQAGDEVLYAFLTLPAGNTENDDAFVWLKLVPAAVTVKKGKGFSVTVTDGRTGKAVADASVDGVRTDAKGMATLYFFHTGFYQFKAHKTPGAGEGTFVRSNVVNVTVTN